MISGTDEPFDDPPAASAPVAGGVGAAATARAIRPDRNRIELRPTDPESLPAPGHRARLVWTWVERQV